MIKPQGTWGDLAVLSDRVIHVYTQPDGWIHEEWADVDSHPFRSSKLPQSLLYLRCGVVQGHVLAAGQDGNTGEATYIVDGGTPVRLGPCHGVHGVSVVGGPDHWDLYIIRIGRYDHYRVNVFGTWDLTASYPTNTSQGFLWNDILADDFRGGVPGLVYPIVTSNGWAVGQNGGPDPARLRVNSGSQSAALRYGYAQRPRALWHDGRLWGAAFVQGGAWVEGFTPDSIQWGNDAPAPLPPDIPWTPDPNRTVDMLDYVKAASTAFIEYTDGTGDLWLHKSPERDNWGENWDWDQNYIGFVEDRSTGTRMVSQRRSPDGNPHKNLERNRLSPEEILFLNSQGHNLGDPLTLPLAGYTWAGNRVWMIRHVTGSAELTFHTDYDWWDQPLYSPVEGAQPPRGRWELWKRLQLTVRTETGYARFNGHEVFARTRYGKPSGDEWNYWGPNGWIAFRSYDDNGVEEPGTASTKPVDAGPNPKGPFVHARFTPSYPIYDPDREQVEEEMTADDVRRYISELGDDVLFGAIKRFRDEACLGRDRLEVDVIRAEDGSDFWTGDVFTGGANGFFVRAYISEYLIAKDRGANTLDASVAGFEAAKRSYEQAVNPPPPQGPFHGPIRTSGRDFVVEP